MNKTTFDQVKTLYKVLSESDTLVGELTGAIHIQQRPDNSELEDVVVNSITALPGSIELGIANVNVHVPDIEQESDGFIYKVPDLNRLEELTNIVYPLIERTMIGTIGFFYVSLQTLIKSEITKQHYVNFRVNFRWHHSQY